MINKSLLIIAISARPYALAAKRSGFQVFVIDGFADADTVEVAEQVETCPFNEQGFNASELILAVKKIANQSMIGCVFGSGLEAQPALLEELNAFLPIIGNAPQVVTQVKNPQYFFSTLNVLGITSPAIFNAIPGDYASKPYLVKYYGGSGGQHIRYASKKCHLFYGDYFQEFLLGKSVSVLFLATKSNNKNNDKPLSSVRIVGFNAQWVDATAQQPFRFGGVASGIFLSQKIKKTI